MKKTDENFPAKDVDEYLYELPETMRAVLEKVRRSIQAAAPESEELISYRIPTYKYMGPLVHFAAFKDHCSLIVVNKSIMEIFREELSSYKTTGTTIHFTPDKPLPAALVRKIVKTRIRENKERHAAGKAKAAK